MQFLQKQSHYFSNDPRIMIIFSYVYLSREGGNNSISLNIFKKKGSFKELSFTRLCYLTLSTNFIRCSA